MYEINIKYSKEDKYRILIEKLNSKYKVNIKESSTKHLEVLYDDKIIYSDKDSFSSHALDPDSLITKIDKFISNKLKYRSSKNIDGSDAILLDEF